MAGRLQIIAAVAVYFGVGFAVVNGTAGVVDQSDQSGLAGVVLASGMITLGLGFLLFWFVGLAPARRREKRLRRSIEELAASSGLATESDDPLVEALQLTVDRLDRARRDLVAAERVATLGYFSGGIAHQIGNPLAAVRQYLEAAQSNLDDPEDARPMLKRAAAQAERIHRAVEGLLRLARPDRLEYRGIELGEFVQQVIESAPVLDLGVVQFRIDRPVAVQTDPYALEQILLNLMRNAVEASDDPCVEVVVSGNDTQCKVEISDNGPGFDPGGLEEALVSTKAGGTGLGIPLAQRLAQLLGIRIEFGNWEGGGCVTLTIPVAGEADGQAEKDASDE